MKMSELILAVGDDNITFQNLMNCVQSIQQTKRGTKVTFYTSAIYAEQLLVGEKTKMIGLVVWMPKDRVDAAIAEAKEPTP